MFIDLDYLLFKMVWLLTSLLLKHYGSYDIVVSSHFNSLLLLFLEIRILTFTNLVPEILKYNLFKLIL